MLERLVTRIRFCRTFKRHYIAPSILQMMSSEDDEYAGNLSCLSKEDLINKCEALLTSNQRLERELSNFRSQQHNKKSKAKRKERLQRPLDFSKYQKERIALKFLYLGWDYQGLAVQENTENTIEHELFNALKRTKLIEDPQSANYSRCGRTDKGVSAFGQVIALDVRSSKQIKNDSSIQSNNAEKEKDSEVAAAQTEKKFPYVKMLNRLLPPDIRILAHAYVNEDFDARFSCKTRAYKYFFPSTNIDIKLMNDAAQKLVGEHDFRNFCKVDIGNNVNHFIRKIVSFHIKPVEHNSSLGVMEITGLAFLWHQVRCMAAILLLIGLKHEQPEILDYLLDVVKCPKKPQYGMASEIPLVLFDCTYDGVEWVYEEDSNAANISRLTQLWTKKAIQSTMLTEMLEDLKPRSNPGTTTAARMTAILPGYRKEDYRPLAQRDVCHGLDRHLEKQAVKRIKLEQRYQDKMKALEDEEMMQS